MTTTSLSDNQRKALELLVIATKGYISVDNLAGPWNAELRSCILTALTGTYVWKSHAGVTNVRRALYDIAGPSILTGDCMAVRDRQFEEWVIAVLGLNVQWEARDEDGMLVHTINGSKEKADYLSQGLTVRFAGPIRGEFE